MNQTLIAIMTFYYFYIVAFLFYMFKKRTKAIKEKKVSIKHFKAYQGETPAELIIIQNHFNNQFQMPILFFIACLISMNQNNVTNITIGLAIAFVLSRIAHSFIHLNSNHLIKRVLSYFVGVIIIGLIFLSNLI